MPDSNHEEIYDREWFESELGQKIIQLEKALDEHFARQAEGRARGGSEFFDQQLGIGESAERFLDSIFGHIFEISTVDQASQKSGVDRIFKHRETGQIRTVEYKTDFKAHTTNRAFIEVTSVLPRSVRLQPKDGWAYTCSADYLLYFVPGLERVFVLEPKVIRRLMPKWRDRFIEATTENADYDTVGVLVPLDVLEEAANKVIDSPRLGMQ